MTPRSELAQALRVVNLEYGRLTAAEQERVAVIDLEPVEAALKADDDDHALAVVSDWCHRQRAAIREAAR